MGEDVGMDQSEVGMNHLLPEGWPPKSLLGSAKWTRPRPRLVVDRGKEVEVKDEGKDDGVRVGPLQVDD